MRAKLIIFSVLSAWLVTNQASACNVGQVTWINGCEARCIASWPGAETKNCADSCLATTPAGYTRVDHSAQVVSQNNGGHSISLLEAGQQHDYTSKITSSYQQAIDLAIKFKDTAAEAKLRQEMQQALTAAIHAKTNKQTVQVNVSASRRGSIINRVRGWSQVRVKLKVQCLAPSNLSQQILSKAKIRDLRYRTTPRAVTPSSAAPEIIAPRIMTPRTNIRNVQ